MPNAIAGRKTNFKNCIHVLARSLEELLLLHQRVKGVVQRAFSAIVAQHQRIRPNRAYPRKSVRPETKWYPNKENKRDQKKLLSLWGLPEGCSAPPLTP
jgi:hypothetical protein